MIFFKICEVILFIGSVVLLFFRKRGGKKVKNHCCKVMSNVDEESLGLLENKDMNLLSYCVVISYLPYYVCM